MSWTQAGWKHSSVANYDNWFGANNFSKSVSPIGYKNGVYTIGVFRFNIPSSANGVAITKVRSLWLRLQGTWSGSGSLKGFICETAPSNNTPSEWRAMGNNGQYLAEATNLIDKLDGDTTVNVTFNTAVTPGRTYYICLYSPNAIECQLTITTSWYPELWLDYDTSALKLQYMQFNGLEPMITQDVVPGSYKTINPANYKMAGTTLKEHWKNQSAYFVSWATKPSDKLNRLPDSNRITAGATINVAQDTKLYPIGALVDHFTTTTSGIVMAPYDNANQYTHAFQGPHGYSGMSIDVPKSIIVNGDLKRRLLYVHQGNAWHMLHGPYQSMRDADNYYTYRLTGRGTDNITFFNAAANTYTVQLIALDDRSIDLATNTGSRQISWNSFWTGSDYRDRFSNYTTILDSEIKNIAGMDNDQHITLTMPVYKIKLETFAGGATLRAKSDYAGAQTNWITSDSPWAYEEYFSFVENYKGLLQNNISIPSLSSGSTQLLTFENALADKIVFPTASNVAAPLVWYTSTWQSMGNQLSSKASDNSYRVIYYKNNVTIKAGKDYQATIYWIGTNAYWFIADANGVYKYITSDFNKSADYGNEFLYYEYQGQHYTNLSDLSNSMAAILIEDEAPIIQARKGDSNGFAYVKTKDNDTQLTQYYIYYKVDTNNTELKRVKPFKKTQSWSRSLQPLVFNSLENKQVETN